MLFFLKTQLQKNMSPAIKKKKLQLNIKSNKYMHL
jgi:hypothetical protein